MEGGGWKGKDGRGRKRKTQPKPKGKKGRLVERRRVGARQPQHQTPRAPPESRLITIWTVKGDA